MIKERVLIMAKAIKSMSALQTQFNSLLRRVDFENFDFGDVNYDIESNTFKLKDASSYDDMIKSLQELKQKVEASKNDYVAEKEHDYLKQLARNDEGLKQKLAQYFG